MPVTVSTPAIVLRSVVYGESDRVVTLLGKSTGRVAALARGARKSQRRFGGGLGVGTTGEARLRERPGAELATFESFEVSDARMGLASDVARTAHAAYALELCEKLCAHGQAEPAVYDWLDATLARLERGAPTAVRLRVFELGLLGRLGLAPTIAGCAACGAVPRDDEAVRWHPSRGGVVCTRCARAGTLLPPDLRRALASLQGLDLDAAELDRTVNDGCRRAIAELLATHLTGPLKSLAFIEKMTNGRV